MSDAPSVFCATLRTARREHNCCECGVTIYAGETYEYASGVWEHKGASYKTCIVCAEFREDFIKRNVDWRYDDPPSFCCLYDNVCDDDF